MAPRNPDHFEYLPQDHFLRLQMSYSKLNELFATNLDDNVKDEAKKLKRYLKTKLPLKKDEVVEYEYEVYLANSACNQGLLKRWRKPLGSRTITAKNLFSIQYANIVKNATMVQYAIASGATQSLLGQPYNHCCGP